MGSFNEAIRLCERKRYGQVSDQEPTKAINLMTFDHRASHSGFGGDKNSDAKITPNLAKREMRQAAV